MRLLRFTLLAGLAGAALAAGTRYLLGARKINGHVVRYREHWLARPDSHPEDVLHYVALGDSAAQGVGASHAGAGYVPTIARRLAEATGRDVAITNLSVSGAVSGDVVRDQLPAFEALTFVPDVVTLDIGGNDALFTRTNTVDSFADALDRILTALPSGSFVSDVPWMVLPGWIGRSQAMTARAHELVARHDHHLVSLHERTRRAGYLGYPRHTAQDWFHPNDRGYASWADAFWDVIVASGTVERLRRPGR